MITFTSHSPPTPTVCSPTCPPPDFTSSCLFVYNPLRLISAAHVCIGMESPTGTPSERKILPPLAAINCQYPLSKRWDWESTCFLYAIILVGSILCRSQASNQSCRELMRHIRRVISSVPPPSSSYIPLLCCYRNHSKVIKK